ncbi:MAG: hypothetical protein IPL93_15255 [Actinomycetales bacterium]|nr:hypothetical protein [Actinomycetales bacterium]
MSALQITAIALCFTIPLLGWALLFRQAFRFYRLFQTGAPDTSPRPAHHARTDGAAASSSGTPG